MEQLCAICHSRPADKTNSHLIPNFFLSMVSSVDNSYERDKELLYTIGEHSTLTYIGRRVTEDDLKNSFDSVSDERLKEMSKPTGSKDYIFCTHCEKKLNDYLESPWHDHLFKGRIISPDTSYFFWVSLLWRISAFEGLTFKLPTHIEKALGKRLDNFIKAKEKKETIDSLLNHPPFIYKVLYCKDYSKKNAGFVFSEYDSKSKIGTLLLGDVVTCFSFHKHGSFENVSFYGLENLIARAPINDGNCNEQILEINAEDLAAITPKIIAKYQAIRIEADKENIKIMWKLAREKFHLPFPPNPDNAFVQYVISELYNDSVKTGERTTHEYFVKCFRKGLKKVYGV